MSRSEVSFLLRDVLWRGDLRALADKEYAAHGGLLAFLGVAGSWGDNDIIEDQEEDPRDATYKAYKEERDAKAADKAARKKEREQAKVAREAAKAAKEAARLAKAVERAAAEEARDAARDAKQAAKAAKDAAKEAAAKPAPKRPQKEKAAAAAPAAKRARPAAKVKLAETAAGSLVGAAVRKRFGGVYFTGRVDKYDTELGWYHVAFDDGDEEEFSAEELCAQCLGA